MDVHDVGDYTTPLAPGMVFTIEPGIYIPGEWGCRTEDNIVVTADGTCARAARADTGRWATAA